MIKLSTYAKQNGINYRTAWNWYKAGTLAGRQMPSGTILIDVPDTPPTPSRVAIYARVSSSENKANLETQAERLTLYCLAKGYQIAKVVKEVGSGINDTRPKLFDLLRDMTIGIIVVEHRDRLTRFGFHYLSTLLELQQRQIEVVNLADNGKDDLIEDLVSIITSFCARLYGQRRSQRKTEQLIRTLQDTHDQET